MPQSHCSCHEGIQQVANFIWKHILIKPIKERINYDIGIEAKLDSYVAKRAAYGAYRRHWSHKEVD